MVKKHKRLAWSSEKEKIYISIIDIIVILTESIQVRKNWNSRLTVVGDIEEMLLQVLITIIKI